MRRITIVTEHIYPQIPTRDFDWTARLNSYEPGHPIGHGPTEADAVYSLMVEIEASELDQEDEFQLPGQQ